MRCIGISNYKTMCALCFGISSIMAFGLSVVMLSMAFGFIHPIADTTEWYNILAYIFSFLTFITMGIYELFCIVNVLHPGFLKDKHFGTVAFALVGLCYISLGILMACWFQKMLSDLQEKTWFIILIYHSFGIIFLSGGTFFISMSIKSYRIFSLSALETENRKEVT